LEAEIGGMTGIVKGLTSMRLNGGDVVARGRRVVQQLQAFDQSKIDQWHETERRGRASPAAAGVVADPG
jgi:hypothetical protein